MLEDDLKTPGKAVEIATNIGSAAASRSPKAALETDKIYNTGKEGNLGKNVHVSVQANGYTYVKVIPICIFRN